MVEDSIFPRDKTNIKSTYAPWVIGEEQKFPMSTKWGGAPRTGTPRTTPPAFPSPAVSRMFPEAGKRDNIIAEKIESRCIHPGARRQIKKGSKALDLDQRR